MMNDNSSTDGVNISILRERVKALEHQLIEMEFTEQQLTSKLRRFELDSTVLLAKSAKLEAVMSEMNESRSEYRKLFQFAPVPYLSICSKGTIRQANLAGARLLNRSICQLHGAPFTQFLSELDHKRFAKHLAAVTGSGIAMEIEVSLLDSEGEACPVMIKTSGIGNVSSAELRFQLILVDQVRQRKTELHLRKAKDFLEKLAHHDPLTGLPNRMMFFDRLRSAMSRCRGPEKKLAVLLFDIDGFKSINDTLGHAAGDILLCEIANRARALMRGDDTIARLGGDEFTVVLENLPDVQMAMQLAQRLADAIREPVRLGSQTVRVSSSIGVSIFPDLGATAEELVKGADVAMYHSKNNGRDQASLYCNELHESTTRSSMLETEFTDAILQGQFEMMYQPVIEAGSQRVSHVEALARWHHPRLGVVMPGEFIPLLERSGQIVELGKMAIDMACQQAYEWRTIGYSVPVAVNVSARQLNDPDFTRVITVALERHELSAELLELEVTESEAMLDQRKSAQVLRELQALGIRITIDDFGTGHSSLARLQDLPVSRVKIDRAFTQDVGHCTNAEAIIKAIISMAHHLDLDVVSEGVENDGQLAFLRNAGSDKLQGFYIAKPLSGRHVVDYLSADDCNVAANDAQMRNLLENVPRPSGSAVETA